MAYFSAQRIQLGTKNVRLKFYTALMLNCLKRHITEVNHACSELTEDGPSVKFHLYHWWID